MAVTPGPPPAAERESLGQRLAENRQLQGALYIFKRSPTARFALVIILAMVVAAVLAPYIAPYSPRQLGTGPRLAPPSMDHFFGTDHLGRDLFSRAVYGSRISLQVGLVAVGVGLFLGTLMGAIAGYFRGTYDAILMRLVDILISFPTLLLALAIVAILGPSLTNAIVAVGITMSPHFARIVRASVLSLREQEFVEAARAIGVPSIKIIAKHIIPNAMASIVVYASLATGAAILVEASLSFLGLGVPPPTPTWGVMVNDGRRFLLQAPWVSLIPGVLIMFAVLAFNLFGDGLRDALDPRLRGEREMRQ